MLKAIILTSAVAVALVAYFSLSLYVFPQSYQSIEPRRPQAIVTNVNLSAPTITLGQALIISVTGTNSGEDAADMQIVSVGFPNLTSIDNIKILKHNFTQTPMLITPGKLLSSQYSSTGESMLAQYASIEAFSRPWEAGKTCRAAPYLGASALSTGWYPRSTERVCWNIFSTSDKALIIESAKNGY